MVTIEGEVFYSYHNSCNMKNNVTVKEKSHKIGIAIILFYFFPFALKALLDEDNILTKISAWCALSGLVLMLLLILFSRPKSTKKTSSI